MHFGGSTTFNDVSTTIFDPCQNLDNQYCIFHIVDDICNDSISVEQDPKGYSDSFDVELNAQDDDAEAQKKGFDRYQNDYIENQKSGKEHLLSKQVDEPDIERLIDDIENWTGESEGWQYNNFDESLLEGGTFSPSCSQNVTINEPMSMIIDDDPTEVSPLSSQQCFVSIDGSLGKELNFTPFIIPIINTSWVQVLPKNAEYMDADKISLINNACYSQAQEAAFTCNEVIQAEVIDQCSLSNVSNIVIEHPYGDSLQLINLTDRFQTIQAPYPTIQVIQNQAMPSTSSQSLIKKRGRKPKDNWQRILDAENPNVDSEQRRKNKNKLSAANYRKRGNCQIEKLQEALKKQKEKKIFLNARYAKNKTMIDVLLKILADYNKPKSG